MKRSSENPGWKYPSESQAEMLCAEAGAGVGFMRIKAFFEDGRSAGAGHTSVSAITIEGTKTNPTDAFRNREQRAGRKETHRAMKLNARLTVLAALFSVLGTTTGCNFLKSRDQLTKGVAAFKNAQYEQATNFFQNSVNLDPTNETAKLYLATTYASQVVPNLTTPDNLAMAQKAMDSFQAVLQKNPDDVTALKQIASINRNIQKFPEAKQYELKVIAAPNATNADKAEADYIVGVVDWQLAYKNGLTILAKEGFQTLNGLTGDPKKSKAACQAFVDQNTDLVKEGMDYLNQAIQINPNYDDAMQYLQLDYRLQAEQECGKDADAARKQDLATADEWSAKAMGARKANELAKEKKANTGGVTLGNQ
jgi:tetratricopeptide (TPR) repeat protein